MTTPGFSVVPLQTTTLPYVMQENRTYALCLSCVLNSPMPFWRVPPWGFNDGNFNIQAGTYIFPQPGRYLVNAQIATNVPMGRSIPYIQLLLDNEIIISALFGSDGATAAQISNVIAIGVGVHTLQLRIVSPQSGTQTIDGPGTYWSVQYQSPL